MNLLQGQEKIFLDGQVSFETIFNPIENKRDIKNVMLNAQNLNDRVTFSRNYLESALSDGLIKMTIPDKPKSSNQKYRLTQAGKHLVEILKKLT